MIRLTATKKVKMPCFKDSLLVQDSWSTISMVLCPVSTGAKCLPQVLATVWIARQMSMRIMRTIRHIVPFCRTAFVSTNAF